MSTYRFLTTDLLSGTITGDWIPITGQSFARNINSIGTFTGSLPLNAGTLAENRAWLAALEPEKSVLWIFQDQAPVWTGIVWDWPHQSILDNTLPLSASTPESLFQRREISDDLTFTNADIFDVFRGLATYALSKTPNGQTAGFTMGTNQAGQLITVTYNATDRKKVYDAWNDLIATYGFEYSVRPAVDPAGNVYMVLDLGYPELGQPLSQSSPVFEMPGNLLDYMFPRTGSTSATKLTATAQGSSTGDGTNWVSESPHGLDQASLDAGYPLLEESVSLSTVTVTSQSQIDSFADGILSPAVAGTQLQPQLITGTGQTPAAKDISLGSWCYTNATSPLHPARADGTPGLQMTSRITGWTLTPPAGGSQQESTQWVLGETVLA